MICTTWMWKEISYCYIAALSPHRWPHPNITMIEARVIILIIFIIIAITRIEAHSMNSVTLFAPLGEIHSCHHQALCFLWLSTQHNVPTLIRVIHLACSVQDLCESVPGAAVLRDQWSNEPTGAVSQIWVKPCSPHTQSRCCWSYQTCQLTFWGWHTRRRGCFLNRHFWSWGHWKGKNYSPLKRFSNSQFFLSSLIISGYTNHYSFSGGNDGSFFGISLAYIKYYHLHKNIYLLLFCIIWYAQLK